MTPSKSSRSDSQASSKQKILLLDGHSLAFRAFFALPSELRTTTGQQTNAVYGFTSMLIKAMQDHHTPYIVVTFDSGAPVERLAIRPEYKATRIAPPDEFRQQLGLIREVLHVLKVPVFETENVEADDLIASLAKRFEAEGHEVIIVTADRDFFQVVSDRVKLMMNRRGISDTVVYDADGVMERYGFGPERYLEYAALRGDPSDNIEGVPGVGEKTASKLVQTYGNLEEVFAHLEDLSPKIRTNLGEAQQRLLENREFFRFRSPEELAKQGAEDILFAPLEDMKIGEWDPSEVRRLFDALEFRTLFERLTEERPQLAETASEGFEAESEEVSLDDLDRVVKALEAATSSIPLRVGGDPAHPRDPPKWTAIALESRALVVRFGKDTDRKKFVKAVGPALSKAKIATHGSKDFFLRMAAAGITPGPIEMDTEIAAYLVDPARGTYGLEELAAQYLRRTLTISTAKEASDGQQSLDLDSKESGPSTDETTNLGLEAVAVGELCAVLEKELRKRGGWELFWELELPLAQVLAKIERAGVKIDVAYLKEMSESMSDEMRAIEEEIYRHSDGPFNIGSPPQLRAVLYDKLGLKPSKKTKTGYSTDASVLESLRDEHPIVDAILRFREKSKLRSTYIDALPPLVDNSTGRLHCRFNQTTTSTGRLSSDSPNLQNIPIRTAEGKQIRRAFIPEEGYVLLVADYSQIELRVLGHMSEDPELVSAFERDADIHRSSIAKALGISESEVSPELRSIGKMVSFGVTYGMGPFGLSQRLRIPVDQARTYIEGFFALYPRVREYLDQVVAQATRDGFTTTMMGRRRYLPELQARNPRVRSLGERMALNAPIQGTAADIIKLAMVRADRALEENSRKGPGPKGARSRMVLTVHDELVFEVPEAAAEEVGDQVREAMENAIDLKVPLKVDLSWGKNWADAKT